MLPISTVIFISHDPKSNTAKLHLQTLFARRLFILRLRYAVSLDEQIRAKQALYQIEDL